MTANPAGTVLFALLLSGAANAAGPVQTLGIKLQDSSTDPSLAHMRMVLEGHYMDRMTARVTVAP